MTYLETLTPDHSDAYDVFMAVLRANPTIASITLFTPQLAPLLLQRAELTSEELEVVKQAQSLKADTCLPFWDAAMTMSMRAAAPAIGILRAATYHNPIADNLQILSASTLASSRLRDIEATLTPNKILAVASKVECTDGAVRHIPQIDFHCPDSTTTRDIVVKLLDVLGQRGYLLASGKSFHFYGVDLLAENEFTNFMGRVLLFSPIVDRAWIAHQLIEGQTALRLSSRPGYGAPPKLVAITGLPGAARKRCD